MDHLTPENERALLNVGYGTWFNQLCYGASLRLACLRAFDTVEHYRDQVKRHSSQLTAAGEANKKLQAEKWELETQLATATRELAQARRDLTDAKADKERMRLSLKDTLSENESLQKRLGDANGRISAAINALNSVGD